MPLFTRYRQFLCALLMGLFLSGCTTLKPNFEQPKVQVVSIKAPSRDDVDKLFRVGLRVINPNSVSLDIKGMSYELSVDGIALASGVTAEIPLVEAYSEASFEVPVGVSVLNSLRLFKRLVDAPQGGGVRTTLPYELEARIDVGSSWLPKISVSERGEIPLNGI